MSGPLDYDAWCEENGTHHGHCPLGCEHPQPFVHQGRLICGRCFFKHGDITEMVPCTPDTCEQHP